MSEKKHIGCRAASMVINNTVDTLINSLLKVGIELNEEQTIEVQREARKITRAQIEEKYTLHDC